MSSESLQSLKVGDTKDNYLQAAIKAGSLDSAVYLQTQIGGFPLQYQNI